MSKNSSFVRKINFQDLNVLKDSVILRFIIYFFALVYVCIMYRVNTFKVTLLNKKCYNYFCFQTPQDQAPPKVRMTIGNITSPEDAENLTVRQLKEVLVVNFVDYKGCVEKKELVERVKRLWHEHKNNQEKGKLCETKYCKIKTFHIYYSIF